MKQGMDKIEQPVTLRDGTIVLGRRGSEGIASAYTFSNRTQAYRAADRVGGEVIKRGRPWYVRLQLPAQVAK